jgi:hypothetical protein
VVTELHDHTVAGRLSAEELEQRVQDAYSARTTAELDAVRRDLPAPPAAPGRELGERRALPPAPADPGDRQRRGGLRGG